MPAIFGSWTHRRVDAGGTRALSAELDKAKPRVAWTWEAPAGARIDQVRTSGGYVYAAAMGSPSPDAPGWEHANLFVLDGSNGRLAARRTLPDPVPVAALVLEGRLVHAVGTRPGEPVFWYTLDTEDLRPIARRRVPLDDAARTDVLDAWALPDGGLWLELVTGAGRGVYSWLDGARGREATRDGGGPPEEIGPRAVSPQAPRDACESGRSLFAPAERTLNPDEGARGVLVKLEPEPPAIPPEAPATWGRADASLRECRSHAIAADGLVYAAAFTDGERGAFAQVIALDRSTGVERWKTPIARFADAATGSATRLAYVNGEVVMQHLSADGAPCSDLLFSGARASLESATLGTGRRFVLDASLGGALLAHSTKADGRVLVAAFSAESARGILGRRTRMLFSLETPEVGGATLVYAGAGKILVKGSRRIVAIRV